MNSLPNSRIVIDSRKVEKGDTFVVTKSEGSYFYRGAEDRKYTEPYKFDSHRYIEDAIRRGAELVVYSDPAYSSKIGQGVQSLLVEDGIQYLVDLLNRVVRQSHMKVVGVTGSTGKSTICELTMKALGADKTYKHLSDRPTPISIPVRALNSPQFFNAKYFVVEMPMDGLDQITDLCQITPPDVGIIANINDSHLVQLGSIKNIVTAKMELVWQTLNNGGVTVMNGDDPNLTLHIRNLVGREFRVSTFGKTVFNDFRIVKSDWDGTGYRHTFAKRGQIYDLSTGYIGQSISYSLAAAISAAIACGIPFAEAIENLQGVSPLPGRMAVLSGRVGETILDDTRIATPQSTRELYRSVLEVPTKRRILIQGPILRDYQHGKLSEDTFALMDKFDEVILYSDSSWLPYEHRFSVIPTEVSLSSWYNKSVQQGDLVVFNGSESMQMWNLVKQFVIPEDEGKVYDPEKDD